MVRSVSPSSQSTTMTAVARPGEKIVAGLSIDDSDSEDDYSTSGSEASDSDSGSECSDSDSDWSDDEDDDAEAMLLASLPISTIRRTSSSPAIAAMSTRGPQLVDSKTLAREKLMRVDSSPFLQAMDNAPASLKARMAKADCVMGNANFQLPAPGVKAVPKPAAAAAAPAAPSRPAPSPQVKYLRMLQALGVAEPRPISATGTEAQKYFLPVTFAQVAAYNMAKATAVRTLDVAALRKMHRRGEVLQCSNRFGESIVHMACRRGNAEVLRFLTQEARVSLKVKDDYGRSPMTDACWAPRPNFDLVKVLLQHAPDLLLVMDKRGFAPLQYVRKEYYGVWNEFLEENKNLLKPKELQV